MSGTTFTPFIILGNQRTGSNLLASLLESTGAVHANGELFGPSYRRPGGEMDTITQFVFRPREPYIQAAGCRVFYPHLNGKEHARLASWPGLRVVHLIRRNLVRVVVSRAIAAATDQWTLEHPAEQLPVELRRIRLDPTPLVAAVRGEAHLRSAIARHYEAVPMDEVAYEDLVADPPGTVSEIVDFLGVRAVGEVASRFQRQNPESLADLIVNRAEVEATLAGTRFAPMLRGCDPDGRAW